MRVPRILAVRPVVRTRFFAIEEIDLEFGNGVRRTYERMPGVGKSAVMVVAVDGDELVLIREYCAGFHEIQLTLVKGAAEAEESLEEAANRELREETGLAARQMRFVKRLTLAPGHMGFTINVMLATDLYDAPLPADEPEPPEVVRWPLSRLDELLAAPEFGEARAIAALCLARPLLA
ncbi:MAG TPA: ADP compounds hydrolase NudE [Pseudomonadales bacterium]